MEKTVDLSELHLISNAVEYDEVKKNDILVVLFGAAWNRQSLLLEEEFKQLAMNMDNKIKICKVDIENTPEIAISENLSSFPTTLIYSRGSLDKSLLGVIKISQLSNIIEGLL